jgi:hypothetical protein
MLLLLLLNCFTSFPKYPMYQSVALLFQNRCKIYKSTVLPENIFTKEYWLPKMISKHFTNLFTSVASFMFIVQERSNTQIGKISFLFVYLWYWGLNSGSTLEPLDQPYFCGLFWDRVSRSICPSSHWTPILLISACWMARITAVSHRYPAEVSFLIAGQIFKARWIWCHSTVFTYTSCRENSTFLLKGYMNFWGLSFNSIKWLSSYNSKWMGPDLMTKKTAKWWQQCFLTLSLHHEHGHSNDCDTLDLQPRDGVL